MVMPFGRNAPKLWPADPLKEIRMVSSGRPSPPYRRVTSLPSIVPTVRLTLRIGRLNLHRLLVFERIFRKFDQLVVERQIQSVILVLRVVSRTVRRNIRACAASM